MVAVILKILSQEGITIKLLQQKAFDKLIITLWQQNINLLQECYIQRFYGSNPDKCHFICRADDKVNIIVENQKVCNSLCEKLLGVRFDYKFTFDAQPDEICQKASLKLSALARITQT